MTFTKRQRWMHFSYLGHLKRMQMFLVSLQTSPTTTDETRELAMQLEIASWKLKAALATRRDQQ